MLLEKNLSGVLFALDYTEFHFSGAILRVFTRPVVEVVEGVPTVITLSSSEAFRGLIGDRVSLFQIREGQDIVVGFSSQKRLVLPLIDETISESFGEAVSGSVAVEFVPGPSQETQPWKLVSEG